MHHTLSEARLVVLSEWYKPHSLLQLIRSADRQHTLISSMHRSGGLLLAPLRYFDLEQRRPGLPPDTAALVSGVTQSELEVTLCNLSAVFPRSLIVQAGTLREHTFTSLTFTSLTTPYPGTTGDYAAPDVQEEMRTVPVDGSSFVVELPPGTQILLTIGLLRNTSAPSYDFPF